MKYPHPEKVMTGFSLVELLVALTIISLLSTLGAVIFVNFQRGIRDQNRLRDLQTVKQSLELYRNNNRSYPKILGDLIPRYMTVLPQDSVAGRVYAYEAYDRFSTPACTTAARDCVRFVLCALREGSSAPMAAGCEVLTCETASGAKCNMGVPSD